MKGDPEMSRDAWKYTSGPKPEDLKKNRYLHPQKNDSDKASAPTLKTREDFLEIGPLTCYDSGGNPFEHYDKIEIARDIVRGANAIGDPEIYPKNFSLDEAVPYLEKNHMFLPSFSLTCAALVWLYEHKNDADAAAVLNQYNDYGGTWADHLQNSIINPNLLIVTHYPHKILGNNVNSGLKGSTFPFPAGEGYNDISLSNALKKTEFRLSLQNLTGLPDPLVLEEIAKHFNKKEIIVALLSLNNPTTPTITSSINFYINLNDEFSDCSGARGFRLVRGGRK